MKSKILITALIILLSSCSNYDVEKENQKTVEYKYGYNKDQYIFQEKKIKSGDTFGDILEDVGIDYPEIFEALQTTKGNVDFKKDIKIKEFEIMEKGEINCNFKGEKIIVKYRKIDNHYLAYVCN